MTAESGSLCLQPTPNLQDVKQAEKLTGMVQMPFLYTTLFTPVVLPLIITLSACQASHHTNSADAPKICHAMGCVLHRTHTADCDLQVACMAIRYIWL